MRRIAVHLERLGATVKVLTTQPLPPDGWDQARAVRPDVVHAFHAVKAGVIARAIAQALSVPLVVTLTGTDIHGDWSDPQHRAAMETVLGDAAAVVVFAPEVRGEVAALLPTVAPKVVVIPQGVWLPPQEPWEVRRHAGVPPEAPVLLLPANIRKVKRPSLAVNGVARLRQRGVDAHLLLAGAVLEADEWQRVHSCLQRCAWIHYLGAVPSERMAAVYRAADIVLNTSAHEGGMANALLEAMALGRPILAADVPGNRSLVQDGVTGLLFCDAEELAEKAWRLLTDEELRRRMTQAAHEWVRQHCDPMQEARRYWQVYTRVLTRCP